MSRLSWQPTQKACCGLPLNTLGMVLSEPLSPATHLKQSSCSHGTLPCFIFILVNTVTSMAGSHTL